VSLRFQALCPTQLVVAVPGYVVHPAATAAGLATAPVVVGSAHKEIA